MRAMKFSEWRRRRRKAQWENACDQLGVPSDVRDQLRKIDGPEYRDPPTWYAGRQQ